MRLSVIVPSREDPQGLWLTYAAAMLDLEENFRGDWEFLAVIDGPGNEVAEELEKRGSCRVLHGNFGGPQNARHAGVQQVTGDYLVFLDSHVIPSPGMFASLLDGAERTGGALVHAPYCFWRSMPRVYGYRMDFLNRFWCSGEYSEPPGCEPFRVAVMGHGAMLMPRRKYIECGGYGTLLRGWGGEEPLLNLKLWHLGESCWVDPRCHHWHYMSKRRNESVYRHPDYLRNFLLAAYVSGGEKYMQRFRSARALTARAFDTLEEARQAIPEDPCKGLIDGVRADAKEERERVCRGPFGGDLDRLLAWFRREGVLV